MNKKKRTSKYDSGYCFVFSFLWFHILCRYMFNVLSNKQLSYVLSDIFIYFFHKKLNFFFILKIELNNRWTWTSDTDTINVWIVENSSFLLLFIMIISFFLFILPSFKSSFSCRMLFLRNIFETLELWMIFML